MGRARRMLSAGLAVCLAGGVAATAPTAARADTHKKLRHEQHHAAQLHSRAAHQRARVAAGRQALDALDAEANAALAALQQARVAASRATAARLAATARLAAAQVRTEAARARLDVMAGNVYRTMASGGALADTLSLVQTGDPQRFVDGLQILGQVGKSEQAAIDDLRVAEAAQNRSAEIATAAAATALATARGAVTAKQRAMTLVRQQRAQIRRENRLLAHTQAAESRAHARAHALERAIARAAAIRAAQARAVANGAAVAKCDGSSIAGYGNGRLPTRALCPLWDAPGQMLQAAAAAAFNQLSHAYDAAFGVPMCVTASYRTYQHQVELYATMPAGYAAVPGTSNHGWGLAVDLCGGVQVDGSAEHAWLLDHAAAYGWFHPAWAMPGGAGPHEPWHWEFSG